MSKIEHIHAHEILDSRGNPTIEVTVLLNDGTRGRASVPSGASTGSHEAWELRDDDKKRYGGKGVLKAVRNVGLIAKALRGKSVFLQREIDDDMRMMDGTPNKSRLGANAILGVSLAAAHAGANSKAMPLYGYLRWVYDLKYPSYRLPKPMMNIMNGGAHAGWLLDLQECMIIPQQAAFRERVRAGAEIFHALGKILKERGFTTLVGDEGGYAAALKRNEDAFGLIVEAIKKAGYAPGKNVMLGMDVAASEFYEKKEKQYVLRVDGKRLNAADLLKVYERWMEKYPLVSMEDPFAEDDWSSWAVMTKKLGKKLTIVGDDLFVTNAARLTKGIDLGVANAILIKVNQIGTLSETIDAILLAQQHRYKVAVSHRSGETPDTTIADLAVATNAEYIKTGSLSRSERLAKYNRLMEIEEEI